MLRRQKNCATLTLQHVFACGALRFVKGIRALKLTQIVLVERLVGLCKATTLTNNGICFAGLCHASLTDPLCHVLYDICTLMCKPRCHLASPARRVLAVDANVRTLNIMPQDRRFSYSEMPR